MNANLLAALVILAARRGFEDPRQILDRNPKPAAPVRQIPWWTR